MIEQRIPYELRGSGKMTIGPGGASCHLEFPLKDGASILETDAPIFSQVFGGALDMHGEPDLAGQRVLVLEDDFYLAADTERALRAVGAEVLGPFPTEEEALAEVNRRLPSAALLDINLGHGATYRVAEFLRRTGVPFAFVTGYDQNVIPAQFQDVRRLEKPVELRQIVRAVADLSV